MTSIYSFDWRLRARWEKSEEGPSSFKCATSHYLLLTRNRNYFRVVFEARGRGEQAERAERWREDAGGTDGDGGVVRRQPLRHVGRGCF